MFWRRNRLFWDRNGLFTKEMWNYCLKMKNMQRITGVNQDEEVVTKTFRMLENGMRVKGKRHEKQVGC